MPHQFYINLEALSRTNDSHSRNFYALQGLGVRTLRLAPVFETSGFVGLSWGLPPTNYTVVAPQLGDTRDLHLLAALLHERNMFLILDVPLARKEDKPGEGKV